MKTDILKKRFLSALNFFEVKVPYKKEPKSPILQHIFAVDPVTRKPASDLSVIYSSNTPEEIKQYIRANLATVQKTGSVAPDAEVSELSVKRAFESRQEYIDRIRDFVSKENNIKSE